MIPLTGGPIVMFEIYIMSWLMGFYNKDEGPIYELDKVYSLYQIQGVAGCCAAFLCLGFVGKISDKVSIRITLPVSLLFRAMIFFLITRIKNPGEGPWYYISVPFLHVSYYSVIIIQYSYI